MLTHCCVKDAYYDDFMLLLDCCATLVVFINLNYKFLLLNQWKIKCQ